MKGLWNFYPLNVHWDFQLRVLRAMQLGEYGRRLKLRRLGRNVRLGGFGQGVERLIAKWHQRCGEDSGLRVKQRAG